MTGRRRGHGEGSVFQRADGRWSAVLDLGWANGKRVRRTVYGRSRAEVVRKLGELQRLLQLGVDMTAKPTTVAQWLNDWLTAIKSTDGTRPSTLDRYRQVVERHLVPGLGRLRLDKLSARDVHAFLVDVRTRRSAGTVAKIHAVLRVALSDAMRFDLVGRNVAKSVKVPSAEATERRVPTLNEIHRFLDAGHDDRMVDLFVLALALGLRRGELLGLRWSDISMEDRTVVVRRTVQRSAGQLRVTEPKTRRSARRLRLPKVALDALNRQRTRQAEERSAAGADWRDQDWVFASTIGTPMEPRNVSHHFEAIRQAAGMDWLRLHDLRHGCGSYLIAEGVDPRTVMEILGHSTFRLTMDTYAHVLDGQLSQAADAMDRALARP